MQTPGALYPPADEVVAVTHPIWVLGAQFRWSARVVYALLIAELTVQPQPWYLQQLLLQRNLSFTITNLSKFYSKKLCVEIKMSIKMSIITIKHPTGQTRQGPNSVRPISPMGKLKKKNQQRPFPGWKARTASH